MSLPLLLSVPHAGLRVPEEVVGRCLLTPEQIARDGDEGAAEVYELGDEVAFFVTTDVARAVVDLNRAPDDRRPDGVVKTHTCFEEPVYAAPLEEELVAELLARHYAPYHRSLTDVPAEISVGVDCHTMLAEAPPVGPDPGSARPPICLSNADGTCPEDLLRSLAACLERAFELPVSLNKPFRGGYVIRSHAAERAWVQLELSRAPFLSNSDKRARVLEALTAWCE